jgi:hypothetical protein
MSLPIVQFLSIADESEKHAFVDFVLSKPAHTQSQVAFWLERLSRSDVISRCGNALRDVFFNMNRQMRTLPEPLRQTVQAGGSMILMPVTDDILRQASA